MSSDKVTITVFWDANGYPMAADKVIRRRRNAAVRVVWTPDATIERIDAIVFTANPPEPRGSITPPQKDPTNPGDWFAMDTIQGNDRLKYIITATRKGASTPTDSPDPLIENELDPEPSLGSGG
jgi:hypothetical protein